MKQHYCTAGRPTTCEGEMNDCVRCGDDVCTWHAEDGLCLSCQEEDEMEAKEAAKSAEVFMTPQQWDLLNAAIATAYALLNNRIAEQKSFGRDASMYEEWMEEAKAARAALTELGRKISATEWAKQVAA